MTSDEITRGDAWVVYGYEADTSTSLDASETLATFMVNDWPDATRVREVAGNLIREATKAAKGEPSRVAICGECAPILWAQGKAETAIELERLWDAIARIEDVDLLCGYSFYWPSAQ